MTGAEFKALVERSRKQPEAWAVVFNVSINTIYRWMKRPHLPKAVEMAIPTIDWGERERPARRASHA